MTSVLAGLVHGLGLVVLAIVVGGLVVDRVILPGGPSELAIARTRLRRLITGCLGLLVLTTIAELVVRTQAMSRAPLAAVIASLPEVVRRTHLGTILAARAGALALAGLLSCSAVTALRVLCLMIGLGAVLTISPPAMPPPGAI